MRGSQDLTESIPRVTPADAPPTPTPKQREAKPATQAKTQPPTDEPAPVEDKTVYDPETIRIPKPPQAKPAPPKPAPPKPPQAKAAPPKPPQAKAAPPKPPQAKAAPPKPPKTKPAQPKPAQPTKTTSPAPPQRRAPSDDYPTVVVRPAPPKPPDAMQPATSPADEFPTVVTQPVPMPRGVGSPADDYPTAVTQRPIFEPRRVTARPQPDWAALRTAPTGRARRVVLALAGAAVVLLLVVAATIAIVHQIQSNSPEAQVGRAIGTYTSALASGDLGNLRDATCGQLHDFYQNIATDQFDSVHKLSVDQKKIPKVASVDSVQITGDKATALAGIYTDADPNHHLARTFDLARGPNGWKVCDPPTPAH